MTYVDHNATTPLDPRVHQAVCQSMSSLYGNPSSAHEPGCRAKQAMTEARNQVARLIQAGEIFDEKGSGNIVFTGSGTEADNLAIYGAVRALKHKGNHLITSQIEHHAVLRTFQYLERNGFEVDYLPVDSHGIVSVDALKKLLRKDTILVSVMTVNNEVGTIQPIQEMVRLSHINGTIFHTDGVQAVGRIPIDVRALDIDLFSLSAHKLYGPKGVGALYVKPGTSLEPLMQGGGQEWGLRPGTPNVPGIVGFGLACQIAGEELEREAGRLSVLGSRLRKGLIEQIPDLFFHGLPETVMPGVLSCSPLYIEGDSLLAALDYAEIYASGGSACTTGSKEPSHVLTAMGVSAHAAQCTIRISLGRGNTDEDISFLLEEIPKIVRKLRSISPMYNEILSRRTQKMD